MRTESAIAREGDGAPGLLAGFLLGMLEDTQ
jgi:hypothetical protein